MAAESLGSELAAKIQAEAEAWEAPRELSAIEFAEGDLPVLDLGAYLATGDVAERRRLAGEVRVACEEIGFLYVRNHGVELEAAYEAARGMAELEEKTPLRRGQGFVSDGNRVLPRRETANYNESFIVKRVTTMDDTPWPSEAFRRVVVATAAAYERLAKRLLPLYAEALGLPHDYFEPYFRVPVFRMRLASYRATPKGQFGISPHVDTSFFTLLASTDFAGLVLYSKLKRKWLRAKHIDGALIVNTGQMLAQITNDTWVATRHYVIAPTPRLSVPFFFNATGDVPVPVVPTCVDEQHPPKYPPISYLASQAQAQGE